MSKIWNQKHKLLLSAQQENENLLWTRCHKIDNNGNGLPHRHVHVLKTVFEKGKKLAVQWRQHAHILTNTHAFT